MAVLVGNPLLTNIGDAALLGATFDVVEVALGSDSWSPTKSSTGLQNEATRVPATGTVTVMPSGDARLRITAVDDSALSYDLREFALLDSNGDALIIHSQAPIIGSKGSGSAFTFSHDLLVDDPGAVNITIAGDNLWELPQASEVLAGVIELATDAEAAAGIDDTRAVTPRHLSIATPDATKTESGLVELATDAEAEAGTDDVRAVTPRGVKRYVDNLPDPVAAEGRITTGSSPVMHWSKNVSGTSYNAHELKINLSTPVADIDEASVFVSCEQDPKPEAYLSSASQITVVLREHASLNVVYMSSAGYDINFMLRVPV